MRFRSFSIIIVILSGLLLSMAAVSQTLPDETDNECYAGGVLEGECEAVWQWECGWYLHGWFASGATVPDWCGDITNRSAGAYPGCVYNGITYNDYTDFGNSLFLAAGAPVYKDSQCKQQDVSWSWNLVYALTLDNAEDLCQSAFGTSTRGSAGNSERIYGCY